MRRVLGSRLLGAGFLLAGAFALARGAEATVALAPNAANLYPTQSMTVTVTLSGLAILPSGTGTLAISGLGSGVTAVPAIPSYTKLSRVTTASTTFQLQAGTNAVAGPLTITVTDQSFGGGSATFSLTVLEPKLNLSITTPSITLGTTTVTVFVTVQPDPGFGANVGAGVPFLFSVDNVPLPPSTPANVTAGGLQTLAAPYNKTLSFPFSRTGVVTPGTYTVPVLAIWTGTTRANLFASANLTLSIPDVAVTVVGGVNVCNSGPAQAVTATFTPQFGFNAPIVIGVVSSPAGTTMTPSTTGLFLPPAQSMSFLVQAAGAAVGPTSGTGSVLERTGLVNKTFSVPFTVVDPLVTPSASPSALVIQAGGTGSFSVTALAPPAICGAPPSVDVTILGLPAGFTVPGLTTILPPNYGPASIPVTAAVSVATGSYPATVRFSTKTAPPINVPVTVTVTAGPDFSLAATPTTLTLQPGASGTIDFSLTPL